MMDISINSTPGSININSFVDPSSADTLHIEIEARGQKSRLFFRSKDIELNYNPNVALPLALLPAMAQGYNLNANGNVSRRLYDASRQIQDIYRAWNPSLQSVWFEGAIPVEMPPQGGRRVATFFSGGVDSFYTLLTHQDEITDLVFVHGFDISLDNGPLRQSSSASLQTVAQEFGKNLIEIETNLRDFLDPLVKWAIAHGSALATIGHLMAGSFGKIHIPATHTYSDLFPWGSHPLLDPLWSTETLEFVHTGCEATRVEKISRVAESDLALRSLRVCMKNPHDIYNCGRCEKCLRTMISLHAIGALERCTTFKEDIDLAIVSRLVIDDDNARAFVMENLKALESRPEDRELRSALETALNQSAMKKWLRKFVRQKEKRIRRLLGLPI